MAKEDIKLVSDTILFKFEAPDDKQRIADILDAEGVQNCIDYSDYYEQED